MQNKVVTAQLSCPDHEIRNAALRLSRSSSTESRRNGLRGVAGRILCLMTMVALGANALAQTSQVQAARLNNIGVALMNQQLTEKALQQFEEAHKANPALLLPILNKGIALLYLQKYADAATALEQAARLDPKDAWVWYSLALVHRSQGQPRVAADDLEKVVQMDPSDADAHYYLGASYLELRNADKAVSEFQAALRVNPLHASATFGLARALQLQGKNEEAREYLKRFAHLTRTKIAAPLTTVYGEQGRYAKTQDIMTSEPSVTAMLPVHFAASPIGDATVGASATAGPQGGACMVDLFGPNHKDLVVLGRGGDAINVYRNNGDGNFAVVPAAQTGLMATGEGISCAAGDYDNDGRADLAIALSDRVLLFHNMGNGKFENGTKAAGIEVSNQPSGLTFIDFDHDGDLDLFVTGAGINGGAPNELWRNNGNSTFTNWTAPTGLGGRGKTVSAVLSDINNDRAVDLVVTGSTGAPTYYANPREGDFKAQPLYIQQGLASSIGVDAFDFNKDGWMDIAVTHDGAPGLSLWRNVDGKQFERVPLPLKDATRAWGVTTIDFDNDGWLDLAALVQTAQGPALRVLRNMGAQGFQDVSHALGLDKIQLKNPRALIAADVDNDGATDLIVTQLGAPALVLRNVGGNKNHSLRLDLTGLADNKSAIGTKVEVFAGGLWQKFEIAGGAGYLSQGPTEIVVGLGGEPHADVVRMLWPTGVPQDELNVATGASSFAFTELDRRGSSCPILFAWDGKQYRFVTDVIGAAVVGHWVAPHQTNHADADEWIKIDGSRLKSQNGFLSVRFGEPMEEINFVDQMRLIAVDHPAGTDVYPDEKFLSEPPFASGKAVISASAHLPAGAWDDHGHEALAALRYRDHDYLRDFTNLSFAGFANQHTLTLDLGPWTPQNPLRLFLHGYVEYFSASSMYAAWQAGLKPMPPYLEAQMPDGSWKRITNDMGFPAGLPRTIVVDLTGKLPAGVRRIRMTTNLQLYWDQILVDNGPDRSHEIRQTEMPLSDAHLYFRGYPQQVEGKTPGDLTYRYDRISRTGPFAWQRGSYTHYGNVTPLLGKADDRYVIFGSGEEIDAEFNSRSLPPLPPHWKRDYFFYANGFVKDMDFYEALPFTVTELPFHRESTYPYDRIMEHYPDGPASVRYQLDWNNRFESGDRIQPYQFNYQPSTSAPMTEQ